MGALPLEFSSIISAGLSQRLTDKVIQQFFESMGTALNQGPRLEVRPATPQIIDREGRHEKGIAIIMVLLSIPFLLLGIMFAIAAATGPGSRSSSPVLRPSAWACWWAPARLRRQAG
jgi:hypothetical protein